MKNTTNALVYSAAILIFLVMSCSKSHHNNQSQLNANDREFLVNASYSNVDETDAGALAASHATDPGVKQFGQDMVTDHTLAEDELKNLAYSLNITIPLDPDSLHQVMKQTLSNLSGTAFDTTYLRGQINDHQKTMALMQAEINEGQDTMVINYATKYLPKIEMHLAMADSLMNNRQ